MDTMFADAVELMTLGMGVVFGFLILLVFSTTVMSLIINRHFPEPAPEAAAPVFSGIPAISDTPTPQVLAAIRVAISEHRKRRG